MGERKKKPEEPLEYDVYVKTPAWLINLHFSTEMMLCRGGRKGDRCQEFQNTLGSILDRKSWSHQAAETPTPGMGHFTVRYKVAAVVF